MLAPPKADEVDDDDEDEHDCMGEMRQLLDLPRDRRRPRSVGGEEIEVDDEDEYDYGGRRGSFLIVLVVVVVLGWGSRRFARMEEEMNGESNRKGLCSLAPPKTDEVDDDDEDDWADAKQIPSRRDG